MGRRKEGRQGGDYSGSWVEDACAEAEAGSKASEPSPGEGYLVACMPYIGHEFAPLSHTHEAPSQEMKGGREGRREGSPCLSTDALRPADAPLPSSLSPHPEAIDLMHPTNHPEGIGGGGAGVSHCGGLFQNAATFPFSHMHGHDLEHAHGHEHAQAHAHTHGHVGGLVGGVVPLGPSIREEDYVEVTEHCGAPLNVGKTLQLCYDCARDEVLEVGACISRCGPEGARVLSRATSHAGILHMKLLQACASAREQWNVGKVVVACRLDYLKRGDVYAVVAAGAKTSAQASKAADFVASKLEQELQVVPGG